MIDEVPTILEAARTLRTEEVRLHMLHKKS
jgi:hypothetical protein